MPGDGRARGRATEASPAPLLVVQVGPIGRGEVAIVSHRAELPAVDKAHALGPTNDDDDDDDDSKGRRPREDEEGEESYEKQRQMMMTFITRRAEA